ncbi:PAS domain-containing protein [Thalassospiraceae bacterium LMO-SO8]|nr:PAS domain-containing protein [Thalassospiraceae bacterium LMO-SO8]
MDGHFRSKGGAEDLEDARARLRAITDNVPIMLCLKDLDGYFMEGNAGFARWHGIDVRAISGLRSSDLVNPGRAKVVEALDQRVIETGEVVVEETVSELQRRPDGKSTIFRMIKFPVYDADGDIMAVGTAMTDITEQKLAQRALEETQARLVGITDNVPIMLSLKDKNGAYQHCNLKFAEWHGAAPEQIIGKTSRDLLPPERARPSRKSTGRSSRRAKSRCSKPTPYSATRRTARRLPCGSSNSRSATVPARSPASARRFSTSPTNVGRKRRCRPTLKNSRTWSPTAPWS